MSVGAWITTAAALVFLGLLVAGIINARRNRKPPEVPRHSNAYRGETYDVREIVKAMRGGEGGGPN